MISHSDIVRSMPDIFSDSAAEVQDLEIRRLFTHETMKNYCSLTSTLYVLSKNKTNFKLFLSPSTFDVEELCYFALYMHARLPYQYMMKFSFF